MKLKILVCFALLLGGCMTITHHGSGGGLDPDGLDPAKKTPVSPPAVLSATVIECLYQQGCHPVTP